MIVNKKYLFFIPVVVFFVVGIFFFAPSETLAQAQSAVAVSEASSGSSLIPQCALSTGSCSVCEILSIFGKIAEFILSLISSVVILMVVIGGVFWITSAGNAERVDQGKQIILGAFIGGLCVFAGFVMINLTMLVLLGGSSGSYKVVAPFGSGTPWNEFCVDIQRGGSSQAARSNTCTIENVGEACGGKEAKIFSGGGVCDLREDCDCVLAYDVESINLRDGVFVDVEYQSQISAFCAPPGDRYCQDAQQSLAPCFDSIGADIPYVGYCIEEGGIFSGWQCRTVTQDSLVYNCTDSTVGQNCANCTTPGACFCSDDNVCVSKCEERVKEITGAAGQCVSSVEECELPGGTVYNDDAFSCGTGTGPSLGGGVCCGFLQ